MTTFFASFHFRAISVSFLLATACSPVAPSTSDEAPPDVSAKVSAQAGGIVTLGDEVTFIVQPGSVEADATIGITRVKETLSINTIDGLFYAGQAYRFSPAGQQFSTLEPATLRVRFDRYAFLREGLDPATIELAYLDESTGRLVSIASAVDLEKGIVSGRVEHFTVYLPVARAMVVGNHAPTISVLGGLPTVPRAGSGYHVRAQIRDHEAGGALGRAQVHYRINGGAWVRRDMSPDPFVPDIWGYTIPAADVVAGTTLEYLVQAIDNLFSLSASAITSVNVIREMGSATILPDPVTISAGFYRSFLLRGVDDQAAPYYFSPDSATVSNVGQILAITAGGIWLQATTVGVGTLDARVGSATISAAVTVQHGKLATIEILDTDGNAISGTLRIPEGTRYDFDVRGRDAHGNIMHVLPTWSSDANDIGPIDTTGQLNTLDQTGFGRVYVELGGTGGIGANQWVESAARWWAAFGAPFHNANEGGNTSNNSILLLGGVPHVGVHQNTKYFIYDWDGAAFQGSVGPYDGAPEAERLKILDGSLYAVLYDLTQTADVEVHRRDAGAWVQVGGNVRGGVATSVDVTMAGGVLYAAMAFQTPAYMYHFDGNSWVQDGGYLEENSGGLVQLATMSDEPVALVRTTQSGPIVRKWHNNAWEDLGSSPCPLAAEVTFAVSPGNVPYVACTVEIQNVYTLYVFKWDGSEWDITGPAVNRDFNYHASAPALGFDGETPYIVHIETNAQSEFHAYVAHYNGSVWVPNGGSLNAAANGSASHPSIAPTNGKVYVAFSETIAGARKTRVLVLE